MKDTSTRFVKPVDLFLLDFQMPVKNGIEVVKRVRAMISGHRELYPEICFEEPRFVFLTAFKTVSFYKHLKDMNIKECYEKPIDFDQLE